MSVDGWVDLRQQEPSSSGQRCMVWHPFYDRPVFAYFIRQPDREKGEFYESVDGENGFIRFIRFARWWKSEPSRPEGAHSLDPMHSDELFVKGFGSPLMEQVRSY